MNKTLHKTLSVFCPEDFPPIPQITGVEIIMALTFPINRLEVGN